jgi:hypothetical protein
LEKKDFTLIDAFNQFWLVWENADRRSLTCMGLYYYLCNVWNACGRPNVFRHQNNKILVELGVTAPTLGSARNWLRQSGLIEFHSKGKGDSNISYEILNVQKEVKKIYYRPEKPPENPEKEVKKENGFTSDFTSHFTSPFTTNKQSIENNTYIKVGGEVKSFYYLLELFSKDEGLRLRWVNFGYKHEDFENGVGVFLQLKHGKEYPEIKEARDNFFHWVPNYALEIKKRNGASEGSNSKEKTVNGKKVSVWDAENERIKNKY